MSSPNPLKTRYAYLIKYDVCKTIIAEHIAIGYRIWESKYYNPNHHTALCYVDELKYIFIFNSDDVRDKNQIFRETTQYCMATFIEERMDMFVQQDCVILEEHTGVTGIYHLDNTQFDKLTREFQIEECEWQIRDAKKTIYDKSKILSELRKSDKQ